MPKSAQPRRVPLLWILLPFALGIALARFYTPSDPSLLALLAGAGIITSFLFSKRNPRLWHFTFSIALVLLGAARFSIENPQTAEFIDYPPREATLTLEIDTLFNATQADTALGIALVTKAPEQQSHLLSQRIFFFLDSKSLISTPKPGEQFATIGVTRVLPSYSEGDRFDAYLRNQGIAYIYKQGRFLSKAQHAQGSAAFFNAARSHLSGVLSTNTAPDSEYTRAYKGLMLGQKSELSPEQKQLFLANGTMHLFAISGLHIGVIALCFHTLLTIARLEMKIRIVGVLICVSLFVLTTGGSASSWRALLMIGCIYFGNFGKRQNSPLNALALSALIYLFVTPGQLFQAGFQMSYLTVSSILLLGLPCARSLNHYTPLWAYIPEALQSKPQKWIITAKRWILDALGVSISAFLISAILGIYYFQILPSYGVLINLIALPLATLAIIAGFLSLLSSFMIDLLPLSHLFNDAALVLIKLIHEILFITSSLPEASVATAAVSAQTAATAILSSLGFIALSYTQSHKKSAPLFQALTILFCTIWILILRS